MFDYKNKNVNRRREFDYLLSKTLSMFKYGGLPETIPQRELERQLQTKGYAFITKVKGKLYSFNGGLGGVPDPYGNPTEIVIANPALDYNATLDIKKDGVLIRNDEMMNGLTHLLEKHIYMLTENEISMVVNSFNARMPILISAGDDNTRESAEHYISNIINGETGVIAENRLFEGINVQAGQSAQYTQLIEYHQYLKASLYNELGLEMNYNMKRERLTEDEVNMADIIYPLIDNMMKMRLMAVEEMNKMFDLEVEIGFDSIWAKHQPDEAFDEDAFVDELGMYLDELLGAPTPAPSEEMARFEQLANQSSEEELQAVLDELLLIQAEEEGTSGDTTTTSDADSVDSATDDSPNGRGESETRESDANPGSSGGDRSDDTESGVDNTRPTTESSESVPESDASTESDNSDTTTEHESEARGSGASSDSSGGDRNDDAESGVDNSRPSDESTEPVSESDATTESDRSGETATGERDRNPGSSSGGSGESDRERGSDANAEADAESRSDTRDDGTETSVQSEPITSGQSDEQTDGENGDGEQTVRSTDSMELRGTGSLLEVSVDIAIEQAEEETDDES